MRTNFFGVVETIDFIGDLLLFAFIGNFKFSCPDTRTVTDNEQKMAFGLEWRLERFGWSVLGTLACWLLRVLLPSPQRNEQRHGKSGIRRSTANPKFANTKSSSSSSKSPNSATRSRSTARCSWKTTSRK
ncbi:hypothetical protein SBV1_370070 [Verrucomicrobia bacterium]|nr:hypothetical protein SBV1_370070 [Verrucomicrobiota bacterium]